MTRYFLLTPARRSLYSLITIIGLGYFVLFATVQLVVDWLGGTIPFFDFYHVPFIILFIISILLVWTRPGIGYLVSVIVGLVAVAIFTPFTFVKGLSSPADVVLFVYVMTGFPLILAAVSYSAMGLLVMRKPETVQFLTLLPPSTHSRCACARIHCGRGHGRRVGGGNGKPASCFGEYICYITIPRGAGTPGSTGYIPINFTTTVGKTVTWANKDTTQHTVTSTTGLFDSGLNPGQTYSHAFTQAGVYNYCTLHSWMKGNLTVRP